MKASHLHLKSYLIVILAGISMLSCREPKLKGVTLLDAEKFTTLVDEKNVSLYTLESGNGIYMQVTNYGATAITRILSLDTKRSTVILIIKENVFWVRWLVVMPTVLPVGGLNWMV